MQREFASDVLARQLLRSATSVGANYRAACRARSDAEMIAKLCIVEEETDETIFWLSMLRESGTLPARLTDPLAAEANEILAMTVASIRTIRSRSTGSRASGRPSPAKASNPQSTIRNPRS
jgi:four helix bundle protein